MDLVPVAPGNPKKWIAGTAWRYHGSHLFILKGSPGSSILSPSHGDTMGIPWIPWGYHGHHWPSPSKVTKVTKANQGARNEASPKRFELCSILDGVTSNFRARHRLTRLRWTGGTGGTWDGGVMIWDDCKKWCIYECEHMHCTALQKQSNIITYMRCVCIYIYTYVLIYRCACRYTCIYMQRKHCNYA
jgi:hypothetical protein